MSIASTIYGPILADGRDAELGVAFSWDDAVILFQHLPRQGTLVLCVDIPRALFCADAASARIFFSGNWQ